MSCDFLINQLAFYNVGEALYVSTFDEVKNLVDIDMTDKEINEIV